MLRGAAHKAAPRFFLIGEIVMNRNVCSLMLVFLLLLMFALPSLAAISISICGSSTYTCQNEPGPETVFGSQQVGSAAPVNSVCDASGKCAYVGLKPGEGGYTPAGWTSPAAPPSNIAITPGAYWITYFAFSGEGATQAAACQALIADINAGSSGPEFPYTYNSYCVANKANGGTQSLMGGNSGQFAATCPTGYTSNGTSCDLTNAAVVVKPTDGKCNIIRTGNTFSGDALDPDCSLGTSGGAAQSLNLNVSSNVVTASQPGQTAKVEANTGTGTVTSTLSTANTNNTTTINTVNYGAPAGGTAAPVMTGGSQTVAQGVGDLVGEEAPPGACGAPGQPPCRVDESGTPTDSSLSAANSALDANNAARVAALSSSTAVTNPGIALSLDLPTSGACTNPTFAIPGTGKNLVLPMCEKQDDVRKIMSFIVAFATAIYLFYLGVGLLRGD